MCKNPKYRVFGHFGTFWGTPKNIDFGPFWHFWDPFWTPFWTPFERVYAQIPYYSALNIWVLFNRGSKKGSKKGQKRVILDPRGCQNMDLSIDPR